MNPFSLTYGKKPYSSVARQEFADKITNDFTTTPSATMSYVITGIRGSGKTVLLRTITYQFKAEDSWLLVDINPLSENMLLEFAEKLYLELTKGGSKLGFELSVNLPYLSLSFKKKEPEIKNESAIIQRLAEEVAKRKKKILVTIDEVNGTKALRAFATEYQHLIGEDYPVYLLMTGLKQNIDALAQHKSTSFLSRTTRIELAPLSLLEVAFSYQKVFHNSLEDASKMAALTKGYAFAYQVLGYFAYERGDTTLDEDLLRNFDDYLFKNGYQIIFKDFTKAEQRFLFALSQSQHGATSEVMEAASLESSMFQNYRRRLIEKDIIIADGHGTLAFTLPRFKEFLRMYYELFYASM